MPDTIKVRAEFPMGLLGGAPSDPEAYKGFIAPKAPNDEARQEELDAITNAEESEDRPPTVFARDEDGKPFIFDYNIKGFFKDACNMLRRSTDYKSAKLTAHKKVIDGLIFVHPRKIYINAPEGTELGNCRRSLRAETAQGQRIAIADSEMAPLGSSIEFTVECLEPKLMAYVREWLEYGEKRGLGPWRNSGMGRFSHEVIEG